MDAPVKMSSQTAVGGDDSTDAYDSDATVSDPGEPEPLVRNGFTDTCKSLKTAPMMHVY
jgi:hypothetical protein